MDSPCDELLLHTGLRASPGLAGWKGFPPDGSLLLGECQWLDGCGTRSGHMVDEGHPDCPRQDPGH